MNKIYLTLIVLTVFVSCTTLPSEPQQTKAIPNFSITADYEYLGLRAPITVPSKTTYKISSDSSVSSSTNTANANPLCINLGNGFYIDYNGTIFISVEETLKLNDMKEYSISGQNGVTELSKFKVIKTGENSISTVHNNSHFSMDIELKEDNVIATSKGRVLKIDSLENGYFADIDGKGLLGLLDFQCKVTQIDENTIEMNNRIFKLNETKDLLTITPKPRDKTLGDIFSMESYSSFPRTLFIKDGVMKLFGYNKISQIVLTDDKYIIYTKGTFGDKKRLIDFNDKSIKTKIGMYRHYFELN